MKKLLSFKNAAAALLSCTLLLTSTGDVAESGYAAEYTALSAAEDIKFTTPDLSRYIHWDGSSDFKENTNYYISGNMKIPEKQEYTLPASSSILIADKASLDVYISAKFIIYGSITIAPNGSLTTSGNLKLGTGSLFENYGTFAATTSARTDISSVFTCHTGSVSALGGYTNIYKNGKLLNYGDITIPTSSSVTVTGIFRSFEGSSLIIKGMAESTLSGRITIAGNCALSGLLLTSGTLSLEKTADFRRETGAIYGNYKTGRIDDYRTEPTISVDYDISGGMLGIDVSSWQGVIDWEKVAKSGVKFAIIRSSYGDDKVDKMFEYNIAAAKKAGLYVGVYHYCYALTDEQAKTEAQFFLETIKGYEIDFPVMFDFEDPSQVKLGKYQLTRMANIFMNEIKEAGYYPMLYSYKNWLTDNLMMNYINYDVAVAEWNVTQSTYNGSYGVWQYSCTGLVSGIEGDVDLDICYKDYPSIIREGGWNHLS